MSEAPRRKKTLGRGMEDLLGSSLESLLAGAPPAAGPASAPPSVGEGLTNVADAEVRLQPITARPTAAFRPPVSRVLAVASGKGGTGKSILAVNLAMALAPRIRVGLIDADMGLGNAHILLGMAPAHSVADLLAGDLKLDEILMEGPRGILLLPGASGIPELASLSDEHLDLFAASMGPLFARCEAVILDCPAGLSRQSLLFLHGADVVMVVTTDDLTSMTDAYALIKTLVAHRPSAVVGLVVNETRSAAEGADTYRKIRHVGRKFLGREIPLFGQIPLDPRLEHSVTERRPVLLGHPSSPASVAITDLANRIWGVPIMDAYMPFPDRLRRTLVASAPRGERAPHGDHA